MEVHHHSHHSTSSGHRKKWTHYFWEFLMLFLAVFCGFLAENQREHYIEHQREKQFMRSLIEDLQRDTAALTKAIDKAVTAAAYSDSVVMFLRSHKAASAVPANFVANIGKAGMLQSLINTDRTSSQLKNSGAMRLIRNQKINSSILEYWKQIGETNISLDRYMLYRNASRELVFKLWVVPEVHLAGRTITADSVLHADMRIIDSDPKKWDELNNLMAMCGFISRGIHEKNLRLQRNMATELISLIRTEYHL